MTRSGQCLLLIVLLAGASLINGQSNQQPPVSKVIARLQTAVDTKSSAKGDQIELLTLSDISVGGKIVVPKGSRLTGHLAGVISKGKEEPKSVLAIVIDKAIVGEMNIPLQAIIAAIAAPPKPLTDDPAYGMMHSNEPKMTGAATSSVTASGSLPASSKASSTATVATAQLNGGRDEAVLLNEDSQGAVGFEDVSVSWSLGNPPPLTVFTSKNKNIKLSAGTEALLRMAPPRIPN